MSGGKVLDLIEMDLRSTDHEILTIWFEVFDNSLAKKWLLALNDLLANDYHLEKNYCFFGFPDSARDGEFILEKINQSILAINKSDLDYHISNHFTLQNSLIPGEIQPISDPSESRPPVIPGEVNRDHFNQLHRYFEDLQGISGDMSIHYHRADSMTKWNIRQLNLLCHEFESWALSNRKKYTAPEWVRPSQLMCWLNAPRFDIDKEDHDLFGIETMNRPLGGVYVGVNKAIGKHHWEVFVDEANYDPNMIVDNLVTTTMRGQLEASGDFDIEWANNPGEFEWQKKHLADFGTWLKNNGFDPHDKNLTIGHPQIGQIDLTRSFGTKDFRSIWKQLGQHLDVYRVKTSSQCAEYDYTWKDTDFVDLQVSRIR